MTGAERAELEQQRAEQAEQQLMEERLKQEQLAEKLRLLSPEQLAALRISLDGLDDLAG